MIGKGKAVDNAPAQEKIGTLIGPGSVFTGDISVQDTMRVDGVVNGNCSCKGTLILGEEGRITGNITALNVFISGHVKGDIVSNGKLEVLSTGRVTGDISAKKLIVDENAYFDGRCTMTSDKALAMSKETEK